MKNELREVVNNWHGNVSSEEREVRQIKHVIYPYPKWPVKRVPLVA